MHAYIYMFTSVQVRRRAPCARRQSILKLGRMHVEMAVRPATTSPAYARRAILAPSRAPPLPRRRARASPASRARLPTPSLPPSAPTALAARLQCRSGRPRPALALCVLLASTQIQDQAPASRARRESGRAQPPARARPVWPALTRASSPRSALHARRASTRLVLAQRQSRRASTARPARYPTQVQQCASPPTTALGSPPAGTGAAGSKCYTTVSGAPCVMILLVSPKPRWCAVKLVSRRQEQDSKEILEEAQGRSGWTMYHAAGARVVSLHASIAGGDHTTAGIAKTSGCAASAPQAPTQAMARHVPGAPTAPTRRRQVRSLFPHAATTYIFADVRECVWVLCVCVCVCVCVRARARARLLQGPPTAPSAQPPPAAAVHTAQTRCCTEACDMPPSTP